MSKVRYGLQLMGKIRWSEEGTKQGIFKELQKTQTKLLRFLNKSKISDKVPTSVIVENLDMLSINQPNAQIKLTEMWKAENTPNYPVVIKKSELRDDRRGSRSITNGKLIESGISKKATSTFINDSTRAWNKAPTTIKQCKTLYSAKKQIKSFVKTLPV